MSPLWRDDCCQQQQQQQQQQSQHRLQQGKEHAVWQLEQLPSSCQPHVAKCSQYSHWLLMLLPLRLLVLAALMACVTGATVAASACSWLAQLLCR
jgi:hypothetical protein